MRKVRIGICIIFVISCIVFAGYVIGENLTADTNAPTISFEQEILELDLLAGEDNLLAGVIATDKEDGDLSGQVQVISISRFVKDFERTVKYIVFDHANNSTQAERTVRYKGYSKPEIHVKTPLRVTLDDAYDYEIPIQAGAQDLIDGDLTDRVRVTYMNDYWDREGIYELSYWVENSAGDSRQLTLQYEVYDHRSISELGKYYPVLSDYVLYTKVGEELDLRSYVIGLMNGNVDYLFGETEEMEDISADSVDINANGVNYAKAGMYTVEFTYTSRSGDSATTLAYVLVED